MLPNVSVKTVKDNIIPAAKASALILSPHWYCSAFPSKMHLAGFPSANLQFSSPFSFLNLHISLPDGLINLQVSHAQLPYKSRIYFYETLNLCRFQSCLSSWTIGFHPRHDKCHRRSQRFPVPIADFADFLSFGIICNIYLCSISGKNSPFHNERAFWKAEGAHSKPKGPFPIQKRSIL